ncbi:MAG: asparaginase [Clostridia bacterium]|nr:asparaginase [Clostridia bacterium]
MTDILVIFTGGTIGSAESGGVISPVDNGAKALIGGKAHFDTLNMCSILSENITPVIWQDIYAVVRERKGKYNGIIITHGSDTLCYTAAAMHELLWDEEIPVVLVAADRPAAHPLSNAKINFDTAVSFIADCAERESGGVFVSWSNDRAACDIYYGCDIMQSRVFGNRFDCAFGVKARYQDGAIKQFDRRRPKEGAKFKPIFCADILRIVPFAGIDYGVYIKSLDGVKAVLHETYHSSTVGEGFAILAAECAKRGIPVFVASLDSRSGIYESEFVYNADGVYPLRNITVEQALMRLMLCCGNFENCEEITEIMQI